MDAYKEGLAQDKDPN